MKTGYFFGGAAVFNSATTKKAHRFFYVYTQKNSYPYDSYFK